jgi:hypothetical protein
MQSIPAVINNAAKENVNMLIARKIVKHRAVPSRKLAAPNQNKWAS